MKYNLRRSLRLKKSRRNSQYSRKNLKRSRKSLYSKNKKKNRIRKSQSKKRKLRGGSPAYRFHGESGMLTSSDTVGNFKPLTYLEKDNVSNLISVSL